MDGKKIWALVVLGLFILSATPVRGLGDTREIVPLLQYSNEQSQPLGGWSNGVIKETCSWFDIPCLMSSGSNNAAGPSQGQLTAFDIYCSNVGLNFPDWVDCGSIMWCRDNYYGCEHGKQVVCVNNEPFCFDSCIDPDTVSWCGSGYFGCWKSSCSDKCDSSGCWTEFNCIDGQSHCCYDTYPKWVPGEGCWKTDWECTSDSHCTNNFKCQDHKCVDASPHEISITVSGPFAYLWTGSSWRAKSGTSPSDEVNHMNDGEYAAISFYVQDMKTGEAADIDYLKGYFGSGHATLHCSDGWCTALPILAPHSDNSMLDNSMTPAYVGLGENQIYATFRGTAEYSSAMSPEKTLAVISTRCYEDSGCGWCGSECKLVSNTQECAAVEPPSNYECGCNEASGACEKTYIQPPPPEPPENQIELITNFIKGLIEWIMSLFSWG